MKRYSTLGSLFLFFLLLGATFHLCAQTFPGETWGYFAKPEDAGFSTAKLEAARAYGDEIQTAALTLIVDGKIVYEWGEVNRKFKTHSIRKSVKNYPGLQRTIGYVFVFENSKNVSI